MKQEKVWAQVSTSYKPLELSKFIENVVLKQTKDQYPVAALWDQYCAVFNAKQGSMTSNEWYERFNTKIEVEESGGCEFTHNNTLTYCAELESKKPYSSFTADEKAVVEDLARDRFIAYGMLKTSSNSHDKIKSDLSGDFTKGANNYPTTPQGTLLLLDKYSKKPAVVNHSEGTGFAQSEYKKNKDKNESNKTDPKKVEFDKDFYKDKKCHCCGRLGHPKAACTVKMVPADDDKKSVRSTKSGSSKGLAKDVGKTLSSINNAIKTMGKALSQVHKEFGALEDDESLEEQSHAQLGTVVSGTNYLFATSKLSMRDCILLDNQSLVHVFCNPQFVTNVREEARQLLIKSNGGKFLSPRLQTTKDFAKQFGFCCWQLPISCT
jgi:hypothetical protein